VKCGNATQVYKMHPAAVHSKEWGRGGHRQRRAVLGGLELPLGSPCFCSSLSHSLHPHCALKPKVTFSLPF